MSDTEQQRQGKGEGGPRSTSVPFGVSSREKRCGVEEISAATRHVGVACARNKRFELMLGCGNALRVWGQVFVVGTHDLM